MEPDTEYSDAMRTASTLLLITVLCTALMPASPLLFLAGGDSESAIGAIDVCHSSVPAIATGGEMPCVNESVPVQAPFFLSVAAEFNDPLLTHSLLSTQTEHPPKA